MSSEQVGWIDIKEKTPEDHETVVVHFGWLPPCFENCRLAWYEKSQHLFYTDSPRFDEIHRGFISQEVVDMWMPIPMLLAEWKERE